MYSGAISWVFGVGLLLENLGMLRQDGYVSIHMVSPHAFHHKGTHIIG